MSTALAISEPVAIERAGRYSMPAMSMDNAIERRNAIVVFVQKVMVNGVDFGTIPGTDKPTLLKPGAEKLLTLFGLRPKPILVARVEDWTGKDHGGEAFFYYLYRMQLSREEQVIAEADGSANSWEKKHRWRWVRETEIPSHLAKEKLAKRKSTLREPNFGIKKRQTDGKYGKPEAYWDKFQQAIDDGTAKKVDWTAANNTKMSGYEIESELYRIPNDDAADLVNTLQKMSQKRALIAATLVAINASEFFTQDLEDMEQLDGSGNAMPRGGTSNSNPGPQYVDDATGEVRDVETHPTNAPSKPAKAEPTKPKHPPVDLDDNPAVVNEWKRRLALRGFTNEAAFMLLGAKLKEKSQSLDDLSKTGREAMLWAIDKGNFDSFKDEFNRKAAGAGSKSKEQPAQKVEVKRAEDKGEKPALTAEDFKDWAIFESSFLMVAEQAGKDREEASKALAKAMALIQKSGRPEETTKEWRLRLITAADDGAFDWQTGKINHVKEAIGA